MENQEVRHCKAAIGVVAIGRNEGDRLRRCLDSLKERLPAAVPLIYVDSGSTDNSVAAAKARGVSVIELDMTIPFTGARARNEGLKRLIQQHPQTQYVQFIDGDCELLPQWIGAATATLEKSDELAVVFGRLRERFPEASFYNQLADMEWDVPIGEADACGGISLMRVAAVQAVGGFNEAMICGEEPELCIRLRQKGWKLRRIDTDMAIHDMDMHRFGQWWQRSVRGGWAVAEGAAMYGDTSEQYMRRQNISGWLWGALLPMGAIALASITHGITLTLFAAYGLLLFKIYQYRQSQHEGREGSEDPKKSLLYAFFCTVSKVPQAVGQGKYWINRWQQKPATLIEYKR
ncbi:MAG: glycosyltransferase family 2 protein [Phormidesmis sp.]